MPDKTPAKAGATVGREGVWVGEDARSDVGFEVVLVDGEDIWSGRDDGVNEDGEDDGDADGEGSNSDGEDATKGVIAAGSGLTKGEAIAKDKGVSTGAGVLVDGGGGGGGGVEESAGGGGGELDDGGGGGGGGGVLLGGVAIPKAD